MRYARLVGCVGLLLGLASAPGGASAAGCASGALHAYYPGWTQIDVPEFTSKDDIDRPLQAIADYAVDQGDKRRLFVTNGSTVMRSADSGCTWKVVYRAALPRAISYPPAKILISAPGGNRVYLLVTTGYPSSGAGTVQLLASTDGGSTFAERSSGFLPLDSHQLVTTPADPKRVYVLSSYADYSYGWVLQTTADGGATWRQQNQSTQALASMLSVYMTADSVDANLLTVWGSKGTPQKTGIFRSTDGGATLTEIGAGITAAGLNGVSIVHAPGKPAELMFTNATTLFGCNADCTLFGSLKGPKRVTEVLGRGGTPRAWLIANDSFGTGVYRYDRAKQTFVSSLPEPEAVDLRFAGSSPSAPVYVRTGATIFRYEGR